MAVNVKAKSNVHHPCNKRVLLIITTLFMMLLFSSFFTPVFNSNIPPFASGASNSIVRNETEIISAINNTPLGGTVTIVLDNDITLTEELRIFGNKEVTLKSNKESGFFKLIGANNKSTLNVESKGVLKLDGIIVTHENGNSGSGVTVQTDSTLIMIDGEITGNTASRSDGGGVFNEGTFILSGGKISENTAYSLGGGVFNRHTFEMLGGVITNNVASFGGGIHTQLGDFSMSGGEISYNKANWDGGAMYSQESTCILSGGRIINNTATKNGGGLCVSYFTDLEKLFVNDGVTFENNTASTAYNRDPEHDNLYNSHISNNVIWTSPFKQGYNNYDISYTRGTPYKNSNGQYYIWFAASLIITLFIVVTSAFYHKNKKGKNKK